jgi:hypothetical protein
MSEKKVVELRAENVEPATEVSSVQLRQKSAFAIQHLKAADRFSRQCREIQSANAGKPLGPFFDEQIACVSATVMLCVASLESNVNEYLSNPQNLFVGLPEHAQTPVGELCAGLPLLEKYQAILRVSGRVQFAPGTQPYQDIDVLISVRNELVHFHPEWHDEQVRHRKLGDRLRYRFEMSPFIPEGAGVDFPQRFISYGCTQWAVEYTKQFIQEFDRRMGLSSKLDRFRF